MRRRRVEPWRRPRRSHDATARVQSLLVGNRLGGRGVRGVARLEVTDRCAADRDGSAATAAGLAAGDADRGGHLALPGGDQTSAAGARALDRGGHMVIASVELPRVLLDTTVLLDASVSVPPTGRVLSVAPGQDAQGAVNQAQPGDVVELQAGGVYPGLILPHRPGWTYLRSSGPLPPAGSRVTSHDMLGLATLDGGGGAALRGGSFWRVMGLELRSSTPWAIVDFHTGDAVDHVTLDRCWIHGTPTGSVTQGVRLDGTWIAVVDCSITDIHHRTNDAQALGTYDGWGPFKIVNCYLEASGENIMFGGWDPSIPGLIPSDIEIRGNYITKPLAWQGAGWVVKNLLEFKNARRVLIEGNIFENSWEAQQQGWAVLLTPRNQNGASPWSTVEDVTFRRNWVRQVVGGFQVMGLDNIRQPSGRTSRVLVTHNLFTGIGAFPGVMAG